MMNGISFEPLGGEGVDRLIDSFSPLFFFDGSLLLLAGGRTTRVDFEIFLANFCADESIDR